jgi:NAD(P)-dependent dehydrogenase (short-subunit alcohol dehydrogenase family)
MNTDFWIVYPSELASPAIEAMSDGTGKLPLSTVPLQRAGKEEDMAATVLFLTSRGGAYLNGQVLLTDGGRLSVLPSTY